MIDGIFSHHSFKNSVAECDPLSLIIALGVPKREKMFSLRNLTMTLLSLVFIGTAFYPFRDIVYSNQNELVAEGIRKKSHEVDTPNIKNFDFKNRVQGHHVSSQNFPNFLTICA